LFEARNKMNLHNKHARTDSRHGQDTEQVDYKQISIAKKDLEPQLVAVDVKQ
jgi:hypothetical protein